MNDVMRRLFANVFRRADVDLPEDHIDHEAPGEVAARLDEVRHRLEALQEEVELYERSRWDEEGRHDADAIRHGD